MEPKIQIQMSANAYFFFLKSIPCREALLQPLHKVDDENAAEEYIAARDVRCRERWAEMDFDGLTLSSRTQQLIYPIFRRRGLLRWEHDDVLEWFVRGPVEHFRAVQKGDQVTLSLVSGGFAIERLREELAVPRGTLTSLGADGQALTTVLDGLVPDDGSFGDAMEQQMQLYYRGDGNA